MNPQEMKWEEEAHYFNTIQYFNALVRANGAKQVLEDLQHLDLTTYEELVKICLELGSEKKQKVAALLKDPFFRNMDDDGRC